MLRPEQDAYGELLKDVYYENVEKGEIIEREDGFIDYSDDATGYFNPYKEWSENVKNIIDLSDGKCLDVGCGAGRYSLYLQKQGLDVHGWIYPQVLFKLQKIEELIMHMHIGLPNI